MLRLTFFSRCLNLYIYTIIFFSYFNFKTLSRHTHRLALCWWITDTTRSQTTQNNNNEDNDDVHSSLRVTVLCSFIKKKFKKRNTRKLKKKKIIEINSSSSGDCQWQKLAILSVCTCDFSTFCLIKFNSIRHINIIKMNFYR